MSETAKIADLTEEVDLLKAELEESNNTLAERDAMLIAILKVFTGYNAFGVSESMVHLNDVLDRVEWKTAGVSLEYFTSWWDNYQRTVAAQLAKEAAAKDYLRKQALAKLTLEEWAVLGWAN